MIYLCLRKTRICSEPRGLRWREFTILVPWFCRRTGRPLALSFFLSPQQVSPLSLCYLLVLTFSHVPVTPEDEKEFLSQCMDMRMKPKPDTRRCQFLFHRWPWSHEGSHRHYPSCALGFWPTPTTMAFPPAPCPSTARGIPSRNPPEAQRVPKECRLICVHPIAPIWRN